MAPLLTCDSIYDGQPMTTPPYRIETSRTVIRCWEPGDALLLKVSIDSSLVHLRPWMPWALNEPEPIDAKMERLRHFRAQFDLDKDYIYGIFSLDEHTVLGGTGHRQATAARRHRRRCRSRHRPLAGHREVADGS